MYKKLSHISTAQPPSEASPLSYICPPIGGGLRYEREAPLMKMDEQIWCLDLVSMVLSTCKHDT